MEVGRRVPDPPERRRLEEVAGDDEWERPSRTKELWRKLVWIQWVCQAMTRIGRDQGVGAVDDELVCGQAQLVALRYRHAEEPQSRDRQKNVEFIEDVEHRPAVAHGTQAPGGAWRDGHVVEHRAAALFG